jgi:hypothetical protein
MNFLSNVLREEGGFEYKKAIVNSILVLIQVCQQAATAGLLTDWQQAWASTNTEVQGLVLWLVFSLTSHAD